VGVVWRRRVALAQSPSLLTSPGSRSGKPLETPVTRGLIWVILAVAGIDGWLMKQRLIVSGAKVNPAIASGEIWRLLTAMFLHSGWRHTLVNVWSLSSIGRVAELYLGSENVLLTFISSGLWGNVASFMCSPYPSVGASGAIFGMTGALAVFLWRHMSPERIAANRALRMLGLAVMLNLAFGALPGSRADNYGHLGGLLAGTIAGVMFGPRYRPSSKKPVSLSHVVNDPVVSKNLARPLWLIYNVLPLAIPYLR